MAEGEKEAKKKSPILLIVGLVVVGIVLASGISYFIATKIVGDKGAGNAKTMVQQHDPGVMVKIGDPKEGLIINIGGANSGRFLKVGVIAEMKLDKGEPVPGGKAPTPNEVKIMDTVVYVLRSQRMEDFDPTKQDQLKELLKNEINKAFGQEKVYEVYITNFVLQ